jgi:hypothetical protein
LYFVLLVTSARTVHLHSSVNVLIADFVSKHAIQAGSYLFQGMKLSTVRKRMHQRVPGAHPHDARNFRVTFLRENRISEDVIRSEIGHAARSVTDGYSRQHEETCAAAIEAVAIGFELL